MIINERPRKSKLEIDLRGPSGNSYVLINLVDTLGKRINIPDKIRRDIKSTMMLGNYEQLIKTFDLWFGDHVILYR